MHCRSLRPARRTAMGPQPEHRQTVGGAVRNDSSGFPTGSMPSSGARGAGGIAVRAGGKGDVTGSRVVWSARHANRTATPILYQGRLYTFSSRIVTCIDAATGNEIFKARLSADGADPATRGNSRRGGFGSDYASPVIGDSKIYFVTRSGQVFVLKAGERFELLAVNQMGDEGEDFSATPAISKGRLYLRSNRNLYCLTLKEDQGSSAGLQAEAAAAPEVRETPSASQLQALDRLDLTLDLPGELTAQRSPAIGMFKFPLLTFRFPILVQVEFLGALAKDGRDAGPPVPRGIQSDAQERPRPSSRPGRREIRRPGSTPGTSRAAPASGK